MRERPWHVSLAAVALGLLLAGSPSGLAIAAAALLACLLTGLRAPRLGAAGAALLLAATAVGNVRLAGIDAPAKRVRDEERVAVRAWLLTAPRPGRFGSSAEARAISGRLRGARLLLRIPRWSPLPRGVRVGDELTIAGSLRAIHADREPGGDEGFDFGSYLRRRGFAAELLLDSARSTGRRRAGAAGALDAMRARAERGVAAGMSARARPLLRGMVLGEDEAIAADVREDFRASGLAHLLAVSGQNVMLLAALAVPLLALAGLGLRARLLGLVVLIALYVPLAGAGPALQRAGAMGAAGIMATALSRPASGAYALLLAAAVTLLANPRVGGDPGWQLSFAAVAGILLIAPPLRQGLRGAVDALLPPPDPRSRSARDPIVRFVTDGVAITAAATAATAPLLAHHFGSVPLASLPANLLALPAVGPVMWLGMVKAALGQLAVLGPPAAPAAMAVAGELGRLAEPPLAYLAWLSERFADVPGAAVGPPLHSTASVCAAYLVLALASVAARQAGRSLSNRGPEAAAAWRRLPGARRTAVVALLATLAAVAMPRVLAPPASPRALTVRFLDVGQGDATLIQDPSGAAILFDGGPPEAGVVRLLRRAGVRSLAAVVATHPSRDHHGGLRQVLARYRVGTLFDGGDGTRDPGFRAVEAEADRRGIRRVPARAGLVFQAGSLRVRVLSPSPRPPGPPPEDPNPRGVVAIVSSGEFQLLLSADAESEALLPLTLPDVDAMKVPHHGSADPGLPEVLARLRPEIAAVEVGEGNTYGHPRPSTLRALRRASVDTYRTDRDGTVTLTVDGHGMHVATED